VAINQIVLFSALWEAASKKGRSAGRGVAVSQRAVGNLLSYLT